MKDLLYKELKLSSPLLVYLFLAFACMTLLPGYPILLGSFFICLGLFQAFRYSREANDITYSLLLPVAKSDVVKAKFAFCLFIELCGWLLMAILTLLRMALWSEAAVYRANALMTANGVFLGWALLIFGCFNFIFVRGFFQTAYYYTKPFVCFIIAAFAVVGLAETLHHLPGLAAVNVFGFEQLPLQAAALAGGAALFALLTWTALRQAQARFEQLDL